MVSDVTSVAFLSRSTVETPHSIVSNTSWTGAISNEPRRVMENFTKKLKKKGR